MQALAEAPVLSLLNALRSAELPLDEWLGYLQERFEAIEPALQAFVPEDGRFERLGREARALVASYPEPLNRPPLFGLVVGVKDIFHVSGMPTRAGSRLPAEALAGREARSVGLLKQAGALVLGKTVSTEFAYFAPGPTRNPHRPDHTPGGSSSGSAAAVAAGLCPLATGTQTIGSISRPASFCGVTGFKPTYDRISRDGVVPLAPSLDHVGVFAREVAGAEVAASILCPDWHIAVREELPVLAIPEGPYLDKASAEGQTHFERTWQRLEAAGCKVMAVPAFADLDAIVERHSLILAAEAATVHANWYAEYGYLYDARTVELIQRGRKISVGQLAEALNGRQRLRKRLSREMEKHAIDLWIAPAAPGPAPAGLEATGDPIMNLPWTHTGLPTMTLPAGTSSDGLPMGLQLAGRWYEDEALLEWAAALEPIVRLPGV